MTHNSPLAMVPEERTAPEPQSAISGAVRQPYRPNSLVIKLTKATRTFIRLAREYESEGNPIEAERLRDIARWHIGRRRRELEKQRT